MNMEQIIRLVDSKTKENVNYEEVTTWYDGSIMDDSKVDNYVFRKKGNKYYKLALPAFGEKYLKKGTIQEMRNLSDTETLMLKMGYYKGISLSGYNSKEDKSPINYLYNDCLLPNMTDNGGSDILLSNGKGSLHFDKTRFIEISGADFGLISSEKEDQTERLQNLINFVKGKKTESLPYVNGVERTMFYDVYKVIIPNGIYKFSKSILIDNDISLHGESINGVFFHYTGTGSAFIVNNDFIGNYTDEKAENNVNTFICKNINLYAPNAEHCFKLGSKIFRWVMFQGCILWGCKSFCVNMGQAVYFPRFSNCEFKNAGGGIKARAYTDLLTINDRCLFGGLTNSSIEIEAATFHIENCDFEGNSAPKGDILILNEDGINARHGAIFNNRFGPENSFMKGTPYDIYIDNPKGSNVTLNGIAIIYNNHTTKLNVSYTKQAPLCINCHVSNLRIQGNIYSVNYKSHYYVEGGDYLKYKQSNRSILDQMSTADPKVRGIFTDSNSDKYVIAYQAESSIPKYSIMRIVSYLETPLQKNNHFRVAKLSLLTNRVNYSMAVGVALIDYDSTSQLRPIALAKEGAIIETNMDLSNISLATAVYATSEPGVFTTDEPASDSKFIVGRTVDQVNRIIVQFENKNIYVKTT